MHQALQPARNRAGIATAVAGSLLLSAFVGITGATPAPAAESTNSDSADHLLAAGTLMQADGQPAAGVPVRVMAWPSKEVLSQMAVGDEAPMVEVASGVSDSSGTYSLRVSNLDAFAPNLDAGKIADLEVTAGEGDRQATYGFSRRLVSAPNGRLAVADPLKTVPSIHQPTNGVGTSSGEAGGDTSRPLADEPVTATLTLGSGEEVGTGTDATSGDDSVGSVAAAGVEKAPGGSCTVKKWQDVGDHSVVIGGTYAETSGVDHWFTYERGASSSLGAAVSTKAPKIGTFKVSGTYSADSSGRLSFPTFHYSRKEYLTDFKYAIFATACTFKVTTFTVRTTGYSGGLDYRTAASTPTATVCKKLAKNGTYSESSFRATTYSAGVEISAVIGIDLSATTGYSTKAEVNYKSTNADHQLCGFGTHKSFVAIP